MILSLNSMPPSLQQIWKDGVQNFPAINGQEK